MHHTQNLGLHWTQNLNFIFQTTLSEEENQPPKKKRKFKFFTNQTGRGDPPEVPTFELVRPPEENHFILEVVDSRSFRQSNAAREITYRARLRYPAADVQLNYLLPHLHALFDTVLEEARRNYGQSGVIRIYISHPQLQKAIIVPPTYLGHLNSELILEHIDNVLYSAGEIPADDSLEINAAVVELIRGKGRKPLINLDKDISSKRSFVKIKNSDNSCLPRAIIVGYRHLLARENPNNTEIQKHYTRVRDSRGKAQGVEAKSLRHSVGIAQDKIGMIEDVPLYEDYLKVSIVVISSRIGNKRVYNGSKKYDRKIFIYHSGQGDQGHFDTITKMNAMMCKQYYCNTCDKGFKSSTSHKCSEWCNICGRSNCKMINVKTCTDCNKVCRSEDCWNAHKLQKKISRGKNKGTTIPSLCEQNYQCPDCGLNMKRDSRDVTLHECGEIKCKVCQEYHLEIDQHQCYMRAFLSDVEPDKFIFYDFECTQEDGKHKPNFVVAQSICSQCESNPVTDKATCRNCGSRCSICDKFNQKEKDWEREPCVGCGKRQVIFSGVNTQKEFCSWLIHEQHKYVTAIAHNARAYDAYFIYEYLMENSIIPEPSIFNGSKIMYMKVGKGLNIRIIDSLNFLPMSLANLPKSFGLEEMKKGFFPHFYNTTEHQHDILPCLPAMEHYDPDSMSKDRRSEFLEWYRTHETQPFDFQKEMREYCISDVDILLKACWKFRELLRSETGERDMVEDPDDLTLREVLKNAVDPFCFLTIASVCMGIFRAKFLEETWSVLTDQEAKTHPNCKHDSMCECQWLKARKVNACAPLEIFYNGDWIPKKDVQLVKEKFVKSLIGLIPTHGYSGKNKHSNESLEWLLLLQKHWLDRGKLINIQHARSEGGEKIVTCKGINRNIRYRLDGYFEFGGKKFACEYNGCNFHGCLKCYPRDREKIMNDGKSMAQRYRETVLKEQRLKEAGYIVLTKWSCVFQREKNNPQVKEFINSLGIQDPINIRDSYFGGRTNALVLHKEFTDGEKGYYVDFTSLYPDILKYKRFPIGHPQRIINTFEPCYLKPCDGSCIYDTCDGQHWALPYFGVMKATFRPPSNLLHPILPLKCNGKLKFPLCYKCACTESREQCTCPDQDRCFTHTYCTPEIEVAMNLGYEIVLVHEVLHWPETEMYDPQTKKGGLFTGYINTFLKLKQQASGFPENVKSEEEKNRYIDKYFNHEGILLERDFIKKNPGLRSLSKLALNSFYGKFGQNTNMRKTEFVTDVGTLYNLFTDPSKQISDFHIMNDNVIEVEFSNTPDFEPQSVNTNVTIASFCTSWARLKLWSVMQKLGPRVLYHDTDSIIFSVKDSDEYIPPLGEYLGDLTSELTCKELGCKIPNCEGHWIVEFVSCGPKNYAYRVNTGQIACKVRGFSLNYRSSLVLNFQTMKEVLCNWLYNSPQELITVKTELRRDKHQPQVYNRVVSKHYGVVYDKRKILPDLSTVPFGFRFN